MPAQLRVIRRRIRTVRSTQKITNAQELIAASRLVRAQQRVAQARPYTRELTTALSEIATTEGGLDHPLLERRPEVRAAAVVVMTSDRGFAGPHNANILRTAEELLARLREDGVEPPMYVVEPDVESVLNALLPRYVAARIFTAMLESAASEWSARRRAMSAATDNAEQLVESLTREYNQARQAAITQEIMEIVGGAEALQQSGS